MIEPQWVKTTNEGKMIRAAIISLALLSLTACASNPYTSYFTDLRNTKGSIGTIPFSGEPSLSSTNESSDDVEFSMFEKGYTLIGISAFSGPGSDAAFAVAQGKSIGASHIVTSRKYESTSTGTMPLTTPTTSTVYAPGGMATIYGSQTSYIPYSVTRYEQTALYFAPLERRGLGIIISDMPREKKQEIGTNRGIWIRAVRNGSPAYKADIVPDDVIVAINDQKIENLDDYSRIMDSTKDQEVTFTLIRRSQEKIVRAQNPTHW